MLPSLNRLNAAGRARPLAARAFPVLDHLVALSDDVGIIQHAFHDVPNRSTGYCTDDVARAFMVALAACEQRGHEVVADRLAGTYLAFLFDAQMPSGQFHNFMGYDRNWLDTLGSDDSFGRALWALGYGMRYAPKHSWKRVCASLFDRALPHAAALAFPRSHAYALLGLTHAYEARQREAPAVREAIFVLGTSLARLYETHADAEWRWFEPSMTYDNARLCEALMRAGIALDHRSFVDTGLTALDFYAGVVVEDGLFVPVGNEGWYVRGGERARYGQQPLEAASTIDASLLAARITREPRYGELAQTALDWFYGRNTKHALMAFDGGCRDGIDDHGANANMGAESTLAYLASAIALAEEPGGLHVAR